MTEIELKQQIQRAVEKATVKIFVDESEKPQGTGFFITGDGYLLTAYHCIRAEGEKYPPEIEIQTGTGDKFKAQLDEAKSLPQKDYDIAVLKVFYHPEYYLPLGVVSDNDRDDEVVSLGYPAVHLYESERIGTYSGKISRLPTDNQIETSVVQGTGHSGAALYHYKSKRVIGIVSMIQEATEKEKSEKIIYQIKVAVQIPPLFKVWPELQALTEKVAKDWEAKPAIAALSYRSTPSNIPHSGAARFVGREQELNILHEQLQATSRLVISAIAGMGGIGKTELAIQYALLHKADYVGGICWMPASAQDLNLGIQITEFAKSRLNLQFPDDLKKVEDQVGFCWQHWPVGQVLVVLDNVTDYEEVKSYLPSAAESRFKVLITTRQQMGLPIKQLDLDVLDEAASLALLEAHVGKERLQAELEVAKKLCAWLGFLPLGLELVGRYLAVKEDLSLAQMQQRLEKKRLQQAALVEPTSEMTAQRGVAAAFELSWEELDENAQQLGCLLSLFAPAPIRWELVEQLVNSSSHNENESQEKKRDITSKLGHFFRKLFSMISFRKTTPIIFSQNLEELEKIRDQQLRRLHLLNRKEQNIYQLHPLVREFLQMKLATSGWNHYFKQIFAELMANVARLIHDFKNIREYQAIADTIPHLEEVATYLSDFLGNNDLVWPCTGLGNFYKDGQFNYRTAEFWYKRSLLLTQTRLGEHLNTADCLHNLGILYQKDVIANYNEAESLFLQEIELAKRLGSSHIFVRSILQLANVQFSSDRFDESEYTNIQLLKFIKELLGKEYSNVFADIPLEELLSHLERLKKTELVLPTIFKVHQFQPSERIDSLMNYVASIMANLATLYALQGRYTEEVEALFQQSLEIWKTLGKDDCDFLVTLSNLAGFYKEQGRYSEAESRLLQNVELTKNNRGEEHPDVARELQNLATYVYIPEERYQEAEKVLVQSLELQKRIVGEHPGVARGLQNLATDVYIPQERYQEAEKVLMQSLELQKRILEDEYVKKHPGSLLNYVASTIANLSTLYTLQGRYTEAEPLFQQSLEIWKTLGKDNSGDFLIALSNLAGLYEEKERYSEAESLRLQNLELRKKIQGEEHHDVTRELQLLATRIYVPQKRYKEAEELLLSSLELQKRIFGDEHIELKDNLIYLAELYLYQEHYGEADILYKQALEITKSFYGGVHDKIALLQNNYGIACYKQKRYAEAESLYWQAKAIREKLFGPKHRDVALYLHNLSAVYDEQDNLEKAVSFCHQAQTIWEKTIGTEDLLYARSLNRLAGIYKRQGKCNEAKSLYERALAIRETKLGTNHPDTVSSRQSLEKLTIE